MDDGEVIRSTSYKIYLIQPNVLEPEIRRFEMGLLPSYNVFVGKILEVFPRLSGKSFLIYWEDEEGDEVAVSSMEEYHIAYMSMKSSVKKFIVKVEGTSTGMKNAAVHPYIYCDGCKFRIVGFRYKCILCSNYDLCANCERSGVHSEHPMLRIPDPGLFKRENLQKMVCIMESFVSRGRHRDRKHCCDTACTDDGTPESPKKYRKCNRRESADTDESEDNCHRKHSHSHKNLKKGKCPYSQMMSEVFTYLSPKSLQTKASQEWSGDKRDGPEEKPSNAKYLRSVAMTLQKFLDPLGVEVDFEVRTNNAQKEEKAEEQEKGSPPVTPSAPRSPSPKPSSSQKEVRFAIPPEVTKQKVDEIARLLANQTMNGFKSRNVDNDGWVEFEELETECEDPRPSGSTGAIPKLQQQQEKASGVEHKESETVNKPSKNGTLYPNLSPEQLSTDPAVRNALEKMLSMGFTNEGNWLTQLLEAKRGSISEALEALDPHGKKHSNDR